MLRVGFFHDLIEERGTVEVLRTAVGAQGVLALLAGVDGDAGVLALGGEDIELEVETGMAIGLVQTLLDGVADETLNVRG